MKNDPRRQFRPTLNRRRFMAFAGAAAGMAALQACGPTSSNQATSGTGGSTAEQAPAVAGDPVRGGLIRTAFPGTPAQLDPAFYTVNEEYNIGLAVYNKLVTLDANLMPKPELAESWSASDDLLTWDFTIRQGVKFHHGTDLTADDVVYTFERILDPAFGSPFRTVLSFVSGIEKVDDFTVRFTLESASADLPISLSAPPALIVPHDRTAEQIGSEALGTGPFKLGAHNPGAQTDFTRNEEYWEPDLPYLDQLRFLYMPEQATQVAALGSGAIDVIWQVGIENISTLQASGGVTVIEKQSGLYQPIVMRVTEEPFTDPLVRQAMKLCANREGIRQVVIQGYGDLGNDQPVAPVDPFWADVPAPPYDPERARELLAEAGYPDGITLTLHTSPSRPGLVEQAVAFQEMARPAGINIEIERVPVDVYWSEYWMKVPLMISNWNFRVSTDETLTTTYHSEAAWNESDYRNPELDQLIDAARGEADQEARAELYAEAQRLISEDGGVVVSYFKPVISATRDVVQGFEATPTTWMDFRSTWLSESA